MGDGNEHRLSERDRSEDGEPPGLAGYEAPIPEPIWRLRPPPVAASVVQALKSQVLPRLVQAFRSSLAVRASVPQVEAEDVARLVILVLDSDDEAPAAYVDRLIGKGIPVDSVFLHLLAPTARRLGEMWERDTTDFAQVTLAVSRLQRVMRRLGESKPERASDHPGSSLLLTTVSGEQHSFGLFMAAEFFRRAGWNLRTGPFATSEELGVTVRAQWFDVVGFSVSSERGLDQLARDISLVRRESRNREVGIILGGQMVRERPELAASVGADMVSVDVTIAPRHAHALVDVMTSR